MGFLDEIRDRLGLGMGNERYDDRYDDYGSEDSSGLLGNTPRPDVSSVSVYTRDGQLIEEDPYAPEPEYEGTSAGRYGYDNQVYAYNDVQYEEEPYDEQTTSIPSRMTSTRLADSAPVATSRTFSGQLPAYVLRPRTYDDAQIVVSRVMTNQPVVLSFKSTDTETSKRIFDFCAGLALGCGGAIEQLGEGCFCVLPANVGLSQSDIDKLVHDGLLSKSTLR